MNNKKYPFPSLSQSFLQQKKTNSGNTFSLMYVFQIRIQV